MSSIRLELETFVFRCTRTDKISVREIFRIFLIKLVVVGQEILKLRLHSDSDSSEISRTTVYSLFSQRGSLSVIPSHKDVLQFLRGGEASAYIPTRVMNDFRTEGPGQNLSPETLPMKLLEENPRPVQVYYSKRVKRITLERFITSKIAFQPEEICLQEILVLYDNLIWCQDKAGIDPDFKRKFGNSLEELTKILKSFRFSSKFNFNTLKKLSKQLRVLSDFLIPKRNLKGVGSHFKGRIHIRPGNSPGTGNRYLPPIKFVGKGYRDKGTLRNLARDGSPSWQEVASSLPLKVLEELLNE